MSIRVIGEFANYRESFLFLALGWLAREDKIRFYEKEGVLYVKLEDAVSVWYF